MSDHLEGDIIAPLASNPGNIRVERVWRNLDLSVPHPRSHRARFIALGTSALLLAAMGVFSFDQPMSVTNSDGKSATASNPADHENVFASTTLRQVVDGTPSPPSVVEAQPTLTSSVAIPTKRPFYESKKSSRPVVTTAVADVAHFDKCKPRCETRDPLVVGTMPMPRHVKPNVIAAETAAFDDRDPVTEVAYSTLNGAGAVLTETALLPFTTLRLGREALMSVSGLD